MSPHAVSMVDDASSTRSNSTDGQFVDDVPSLIDPQKSLLRRADDDEVHDLVCVGFGPASLAIAVALHDALEADRHHTLSPRAPKVRFLERQEHFAWHAGMLLPGAKMQITFVKDLATLRNPRSHFTFLNYLHHKGRLSAFTNLGTFLPRRTEYEDYMRWCATRFTDVVDYSRSVESVEAVTVGRQSGNSNGSSGPVGRFRVTTSPDPVTGRRSTLVARHVVIAAGGKPNLPTWVPSTPRPNPRILHSSQYATHVESLFPASAPAPRRFAVIGGGQSAAEVFHNIPTRFPGAQSVLLIRGTALKPSDDSPFVNEVFDPEKVDDTFAQEPELRARGIAQDKATNYGVVRLELLEEIYGEMYSYKLEHASEERWPRRILNHRSVTEVRDVKLEDGRPGLELTVQNDAGRFSGKPGLETEKLTVDAVIVASGYVRDSHEEMLNGLRHLMPGGDAEGKRWTVNRQYGVEFGKGKVRDDAGVWLQGCNEGTHGLSDTLLSILAVRGGEVVESIFGAGREQKV